MDKNSDSKTKFTYQQENLILISGIGFAVAGFIWGLVYFALGETTVGLIPISYSIFLLIPLVVYVKTKSVEFFLFFQFALLIVIPFAMHLTLGGFHNSSFVILWGLVPIGFSFIFSTPKQVKGYIIAFVIEVIIAVVAEPSLIRSSSLSNTAITAFYVLNIGVVGTILFFIQRHIRSKKAAPSS